MEKVVWFYNTLVELLANNIMTVLKYIFHNITIMTLSPLSRIATTLNSQLPELITAYIFRDITV